MSVLMMDGDDVMLVYVGMLACWHVGMLVYAVMLV